MPAPDSIRQLVVKFDENREAYRSGKYNEAQLRQEFLDRFFEALDWDITIKNGSRRNIAMWFFARRN